jgi:hypothetical protein
VSLSNGAVVPDFTVYKAFGEAVTGPDLWRDQAALFLFYIFDFSGNLEGG